MTSSSTAYFVTAIANGNAMKVIMTTTGLKFGEENKKPSATSTRPWPRVTPQATGTEQFAHTPAGTPTRAPLTEFR